MTFDNRISLKYWLVEPLCRRTPSPVTLSDLRSISGLEGLNCGVDDEAVAEDGFEAGLGSRPLAVLPFWEVTNDFSK